MYLTCLFHFRSQGSSKQNGGESESSDISTVELEILRPTFAVQRSSAPLLEASHSDKHAVRTYNIVRTNVPVLHAQTQYSEDNFGINSAYKEKQRANGGFTDTTSSTCSSLDSDVSKNSTSIKNSSQSFAGISLSSKKTKTPETLVVEKKGGVNQLDFRGVLKKNPTKHLNDADSNGHSKKLVSDFTTPRLKQKENRVDLSQRKALFEGGSVQNGINVNSNSTVVRRKESGTNDKIIQARKQFEDNVSDTHSDFRSLLKPQNDSSVIGKESSTGKSPKPEPVSQHDFRSVLKPRVEPDQRDKAVLKEPYAKSTVQSDKKIKIPAAFESVEKVKRRPDPRLSLDIGRDRPKIDASRSVRNNRLKEITDKLEFKSVLKPSDSEKIRSQDKQNGEVTVLRPIPRRLSQTKPTNMDATPRRLSQSKSSVMEVKPVFKDSLVDKSVEYGSEVVLECHVTGSPNPDICWSINDKEIKVKKFIIDSKFIFFSCCTLVMIKMKMIVFCN